MSRSILYHVKKGSSFSLWNLLLFHPQYPCASWTPERILVLCFYLDRNRVLTFMQNACHRWGTGDGNSTWNITYIRRVLLEWWNLWPWLELQTTLAMLSLELRTAQPGFGTVKLVSSCRKSKLTPQFEHVVSQCPVSRCSFPLTHKWASHASCLFLISTEWVCNFFSAFLLLLSSFLSGLAFTVQNFSHPQQVSSKSESINCTPWHICKFYYKLLGLTPPHM